MTCNTFIFQYKMHKKAATKTGFVIAINEAGARSLLNVSLLAQTKISLTKKQNIKNIYLSSEEQVTIFQWLQMTTSSGMQLLNSLNELGKTSSSKKISSIAFFLARKISTGSKLSESLEEFSSSFSKTCCALISAGEQGGKMSNALKRVSLFVVKQKTSATKLRNALIYPSILVVATFCLISFLTTIVIPNIKNSLDIQYNTLPLISKIVFSFSDFICHYLLLAKILVAFFTYFIATNTKQITAYLFSKRPLKDLAVANDIALCFTVIGDLTSNNINTIDSMKCALNVADTPEIKEWMTSSIHNIKNGNLSLFHKKFLPAWMTLLFNAGLKSGQVSNASNEIASLLQEEYDKKMNTFIELIGPVSILVIMSVLGVSILSVMLPMTSITF